MIAVAFGLGWLGYSLGLYGYCLIKGYDVKLLTLMNPAHGGYQWPQGGPPLIPPTQVFPTGTKGEPPQATLA